MNIFTTEPFLETLGEVFFPKRRRALELCRVEGRLLRLLVLDGHEVVRRAPFYDFPQPLEGEPTGPVRDLRYFPRTVVRTTAVEEPMPAAYGFQPSPYLDWVAVPDWAAAEKHFEARGAPVADSRRKRRRAEKELGPISFLFDDERPETFEACLRWKGAQYVATGGENLFAREACVELFRRLRRSGVLVVNSLSMGGRLVATHLASLHDRRLTWWVPAYDAAFGRYSPGRLLLEELLRESQARGHLEFDFLIGDEPYKFHYATHTRVIGPVGTPPLRERLLTDARRVAKQALARYPRVNEIAHELRARVREARRSHGG